MRPLLSLSLANTKTTSVRVEIAQYCCCDFIMTQKAANEECTAFTERRLKAAAVLDCKLEVAQVLPTFRPEIRTSGGGVLITAVNLENLTSDLELNAPSKHTQPLELKSLMHMMTGFRGPLF